MKQQYVYLIEYPEFFKRECYRNDIEIPDVCKHPNDLINWFIDNDQTAINPFLRELHDTAYRKRDAMRGTFKVEISKNMRESDVSDLFSFDFLSPDHENRDEDIVVRVLLEKPLIVNNTITEHVDEVKVAGLPYQPASVKVVGEETIDLGIDVVCEFYLLPRLIIGI